MERLKGCDIPWQVADASEMVTVTEIQGGKPFKKRSLAQKTPDPSKARAGLPWAEE